MTYCPNETFKHELASTFAQIHILAMDAEKLLSGYSEVSQTRQLEIAETVALKMNDQYYNYIPQLGEKWVPHVTVGVAELDTGEKVLALEVYFLSKFSFGLIN